ncbi:type II toxin-antitoxin system VapC family toxin [Morganella morganii subsp. sibonii]
MGAVCIIDTSVFLNLLNVPGRNQDKDSVSKDFLEFAGLGATFIVPMATIIETGNHIAQNGDGRLRRETAMRFRDAVRGAFEGEAPYHTSTFPDTTEILTWLDRFPDAAGQNKSPTKTSEGTSFGDLSIIAEFEKNVKKFPKREIFIWSLDSDLNSYSHNPVR